MMSDITQVCTFLIDRQLFGVDVQRVQEVIRYQDMTHVPLAPESVCGLINLRGQIVTAVDLRQRLGMPPRASDGLPMNVVIRTDDGAVSLLVDRIGDVQEVGTDHFEQPPETMSERMRSLVKGVYKMKERLLLILDADSTVRVHDLEK